MPRLVPSHLPLLLLLLPVCTPLCGQTLVDRARQDVTVLTSPEFLGRGLYGDGHLKAAEFIRDSFRRIGLDSIGGSYFQPFPLREPMIVATPRLAIDGRELRFGIDYLPELSGGSGEVEGADRIVMGGHGIVVPDRGIDDYGDADLDGGIVVIDGDTPKELSADTTIDRVLLSTEARIYIASLRRAKGMLIGVDRLVYGDVSEEQDLPVFKVRRAALPETIHEVSFSVSRRDRSVQTNNVVGMIRGAGPSDSTIVVCAHYDHLGAVDDSLYFPGANDNASGVAMLLALARSIREHPLQYSVIFIAFGGEESGLHGSRYYVGHPLHDLATTRFLVNMDMTASGNEGVMALGGVEFSDEFALLQHIDDSLGLGELRKRANAPNSDQYFFLRKGVRGFYIYPFTGQQPYHHVDDRVDTLEWNVFEKLFRLVDAFLRDL